MVLFCRKFLIFGDKPVKVLGTVILALVLLSSLAAATVTPPKQVSAGDSGNYRLLVFPFFLQVTPRDKGSHSGWAGVYVWAYGGINLTVDLNHNGIADPGEPSFAVPDQAGRWVRVFIGYSDYHGLKPAIEVGPGAGPLWLLVDRPVLANYYWVGYTEDDNTLAYSMPPPGKEFTVPPLPGILYLSPADPSGAVVNVNGSQYELGPSDYLVIKHAGGVLRITSDRDVVVALISLKDGLNDTYATEVVPDEWFTDDPAMLFGGNLTRVWGSGDYMETYAIAVTEDGVGVARIWEYPASVRIGDKFFHFDARSAVYYYLRSDEGDHISSAALAVYNTSKWWDYFGEEPGYWVTVISAYGKDFSTYTRSVFVSGARYGIDGTAVFLDIDGDKAYELFGKVDHVIGPLVIAAPPWRSVGLLVVSESSISVYDIFGDYSSFDRAYAEARGVPVPRDRYAELTQHLGLDPLWDIQDDASASIGKSWNIDRDYIRGTCRPGSSVRFRADVDVSLEPAEEIYAFASTPDWSTNITASSTNGTLTLTLNYESEDEPMPPMINIFFTAERGGDRAYFVSSLHSQCWLPQNLGKEVPGTSPGEGPEVPTVETALEAEAEVLGSSYTAQIPHLVLDWEWIKSEVTGAPPTTTTTTTPTGTTTTPPPQTTTTPTTTTSPQVQPPIETTTPTTTTTTTGATMTETSPTTTTSATAPQVEGLSIGNGSKLTYVFEYSGTGPTGSVSGRARIEYTLVLRPDGAVLMGEALTNMTENDKAMFLLGASVSDLFLSAAGAGGSILYGPGLTPEIHSECPALSPGKEGEHRGEVDTGVTRATYVCRYSGGVLQSVEAHVTVSYGGQEATATLRAYIEGAAPSGGLGLGSTTLVIIIVAVAAAAAVAIALITIKRK